MDTGSFYVEAIEANFNIELQGREKGSEQNYDLLDAIFSTRQSVVSISMAALETYVSFSTATYANTTPELESLRGVAF